MPKGFAIPVQVSAGGSISLSSGDENDMKIIRIALSDGDNENAYQQNVTLGNAHVFDLNDSSARSRISGKIETIFEKFEDQHRFKLLGETLEWIEKEGELKLNFSYLCLESDQVKNFSHIFKEAN